MTRNFLVLTHVSHHYREGKWNAYAPYVREMNLWFKNVEKPKVVAPVEEKSSFTKEEPYQTDSLVLKSIPSFSLLSLKNSLKALLKIPVVIYRIFHEMGRADHLHMRCPGNIGLIACCCQVFFPKKPKTAKYAGNWDPQAKQPWTYRLQKWILSNTFLTRKMQVLVYGEWPGQSKNIIPFFTASFSEEEKSQVSEKRFLEPFIFLFVGNLVEGKRPLEAVKLVEAINAAVVDGPDQEFRARLEIYGDGPERENITKYVRENGLEEVVRLQGSRALKELKKAYQKAHFVILPSRSEGWPKAVAEGMFFGCIPIATPVSCVPWMLGGGTRGILLSNSEQEGKKKLSEVSCQFSEDVEKVENLLKSPQEMKKMSLAAKDWSQQYTLERFEEAIKGVLNYEKFNV